VWGIDLGNSLLRYASARARLLHHAVHFAQQDAERTGFDDRSFDLIVSHILLHETPAAARRRLFAEGHRLLRPEGLMEHLDSARFLRPSTPAARYFRDTEVWVNSEPFLASCPDHAFACYALEAGFAPDRFQVHELTGHVAGTGGSPHWLAFCARKS
jgi:SAM-dependent methyltransferase